jgi:hypothetical protein
MSLSVIQATGVESVGSVASVSKAFVSNVVSGNLLVIGGVAAGGRLTATSVSDTRSSTYARDSNAAIASSTQACLYSAVLGSSGTCTVTLTPSSSDVCSIAISETSGQQVGGTLLDTQNVVASAASSATVTTANLVTGQQDVIFAVMSHGGSTTGITEDATYTLGFEDTNATNQPINFAYKIVASGTYTGSWTLAAAQVNRAGAAAAYKQAAAGGGGLPIGALLRLKVGR